MTREIQYLFFFWEGEEAGEEPEAINSGSKHRAMDIKAFEWTGTDAI